LAFILLQLPLWSSQLSFLGSSTPSSAELLKRANASQYHYHSSQAILVPTSFVRSFRSWRYCITLCCLCYSQHFCLRIPQSLKDSLLKP
jgi:hypothetical protein